MSKKQDQFLPALRFSWLTRFYDPLVKLTTKEFTFKRALLTQADLRNDQKILDLACGTGTLSIGIKKRVPDAQVFGIDADEKILKIARLKANNFKTRIYFNSGFSDALPYEDETFDLVFSTLFFHHITLHEKVDTLREILRVIKPNGVFHLADFGLPVNIPQKIFSNIIRYGDGVERTKENLQGRLLQLIENNGFSEVEETKHFKTILGTIRLLRAFKS